MNPSPLEPSSARPAPTSRAKRRSRRGLPYLGALLLAGLITAGLWPKPVAVETARAVVGPLRVAVSEEGKTRIKQRYLVSAPVTGFLRRIALKAGAEVRTGETDLAVIESVQPALLDARARTLAEARRDTASANLEKARAAHTFAASERHRFDKLFQGNTVSAQELETAQWHETAAAREETAAASALRQAEAELAEFFPASGGDTNTVRYPTEVKAPVNGRVLRVLEESARVVTAGTPLLEVGDPGDLEVVIQVLSRDGAALTPGTRVEMDQWGGAAPLLGQVRFVEPAAFTKVSALGVEEQRVNVVANLLTPPDQRPGVGDNFRVEARIIVWEQPQVLKLPAGALFRRGQDWGVFVLAEGRAYAKTVQVGRSNGTESQILEGLKDGDEVILYPGDRVHDGQRVRPIKI